MENQERNRAEGNPRLPYRDSATALHFAVSIRAPKTKVWNAMLGPETFKQWTAPFMPGSYYEGSWDKGAKIRFLTPQGEGMTAIIAENRPYELVSIKHMGFVKDFADDTESAEVKSFAPAYENYSLSERNGVTELRVGVDSFPNYDEMFKETWPKALDELKRICEQS